MIGSADDILDVAVVGGGVAGAYSAWRLLCDRGPASGRPLKLAVFEGSDRIGGRMLSLRPPGMPHLWCELGAMYFLSCQPLVCSVVQRLGLPTQDVPRVSGDLYYLRRSRLRSIASSQGLPYDFTSAERQAPPPDLIYRALDALIPGITKLTGKALDERLANAKVDGLAISDWGFWNLLYRAMSSEAFQFTSDTTPDDYIFLNWNSVDAIRGMQIFGPSTKVFHLTDGYEELPRTLARRVEAAGGRVHMRHRLMSLERADDGLVRLHLARNSEGWGPGASGERCMVYARSVILALPKRSLDLIEQTGPLFEDSEYQRLHASVTPLPIFKMFSCYDAPWWERLGFKANGMAATDMPLRTCLYWGTEGAQPGGDPRNRNSLALTSFDDARYASFWAGLRDPHHGPAFQAKANAVLFGHAGSPEWARYADCTTDRIVREAQRQLTELHGIPIPEPYAVASMDWGRDPFGGAGNLWNVFARSEDITERMLQPVEGLPVYVCGEAYSRAQGWAEGALETTERMLERYFGLGHPPWLHEAPVDVVGDENTKGKTLMTDKNQTPGMLVRAPDGKLYFIPESKLAAFAVPDKGTAEMNKKLSGATVAANTSIPTEWMNVGMCIIQHG